MNNFEEQLSRFGIENEDGTVDRLRSQVPFKCLVDCNSVNVGVVNEPDDLVRKDLRVVLRVEIWLCWLAGVELEAFADPFA